MNCETCPISIKAQVCCGSNPETQEFKIVRLTTSGLRIPVCPSLESDGSCADYLERPEDCRAYVCEALYEQGLGS